MQVSIMMVEDEIKDAIVAHIASHYGVTVSKQSLNILVKSKQNFKSEWETASIKVDCQLSAERD